MAEQISHVTPHAIASFVSSFAFNFSAFQNVYDFSLFI